MISMDRIHYPEEYLLDIEDHGDCLRAIAADLADYRRHYSDDEGLKQAEDMIRESAAKTLEAFKFLEARVETRGLGWMVKHEGRDKRTASRI